MTLASWFSSLRHSRRRLTQTRARRNRSRAFNRSASFEALEDRRLLSTVSFITDTEIVNESTGTFSIPVTLSSPPAAPTVSAFASGFDASRRPGLRRRRQPLCRRLQRRHGGEVTPAGVISTIFATIDGGFIIPLAWPSTPPATSTSPTTRRHGEQGDAHGAGQHLRLRVRQSRRPGLRRRRQPLRRQQATAR